MQASLTNLRRVHAVVHRTAALMMKRYRAAAHHGLGTVDVEVAEGKTRLLQSRGECAIASVVATHLWTPSLA